MGSDSQTTVQKADPWEASQPYLRQAMADAASLYDQGGYQIDPYMGTRNAYSPTLYEGIIDMRDQARGGAPGIDAASDFTRSLYGGGTPIDTGRAGGVLSDMMGTGMGPGYADANQTVRALTNPNAGPDTGQAQRTLSQMMSGNYQDDRLAAVRDEALGSAVPAAVAQFAGSGMANSSQAMDAVGRAAASAVAPLDYQAAENAQNRAMSAAGMQYGQSNTALDRAMRGAGMQYGQQNALRGMSMDAALAGLGLESDRDRLGLAAAGMAPELQRAGFLPSQMMTAAGQMQDAKQQQFLDADMQRYYEAENAPIDALNRYSGLLLGYGGQGGTTSGTNSSSPSGLDVAGMGLNAGMLAALMFSDRRLKRSARKIGKTPGGHNLYGYKYLDDETLQVGVMADEVPHAIAGYVGGYAVVDYARVY